MNVFSLLLVMLGAVTVTFANGQPGPQSAGEERRERAPKVIMTGAWATDSLVWEYVIGPPPDNGVPLRFYVRCNKAGQPIPERPPIEAPPVVAGKITARIPLKSFLPGPGGYECTVTPWNPEAVAPENTTGEGPPSPPFSFSATGGLLVAPSRPWLE